MYHRRHNSEWRLVHGGGISVYDTITDGTVTWTVLNVFVALKDKAGNDLEAVVAKALTVNGGYVKYKSGLIIQWGMQNAPEAVNKVTVNLPISFSNNRYMVTTSLWDDNLTTISTTSVHQHTVNSFNVYTVTPTSASRIWHAIGY